MVAFRSFLAGVVVALHLGSYAHAQGLFESTGARDGHLVARSHLEQRQSAVLSTQTCAPVDLTVLTVVVARGLVDMATASHSSPG
jgi:hypothetical protein